MASFKVRVHNSKQALSEKELQLSEYLLANRKYVSSMTIQSISSDTKISTATVSRFAKKLGYTNFQSLRLSLAEEKTDSSKLFEEINENDSLLEMSYKIFNSSIDALKMTSQNLSERLLKDAIKIILQAKTLGIFGLGASNVVALDGYHKFLRTSINVNYASDYHMQLMAMTRFDKTDAAIIISHTGMDKNAIELAEIAKKNEVPLILITGIANSPLAEYANVVLLATAEETQYRAEALHALVAQISLIDTLFMLVAIKTNAKSVSILDDIRETIQKTRKKKL